MPSGGASRAAISSRCGNAVDRGRPRAAVRARARLDVRPRDPHGKHERQARSNRTTSRPGPRLRRQPARRRESPDRRSTAPRRPSCCRARSRSAAARNSGCTPHSSASRICASAALVREPSSSASVRTSRRRHAEVQLHAQHRPAAGDAGVGNDRLPRLPQPFDRRHQRHIEPPRGQRIGQPARQIVKQPRLAAPQLSSPYTSGLLFR